MEAISQPCAPQVKMTSLCEDLSEFLDLLKKMRFADDKIVYSLNTSIPTESFATKVDATAKCKDLFTQLVQNHTARESTLEQCLNATVRKVQILRKERDANPDDSQSLKKLRQEQYKLRELQTQINVEEVIRGRTLKLYNERCRGFYKPDTPGASN